MGCVPIAMLISSNDFLDKALYDHLDRLPVHASIAKDERRKEYNKYSCYFERNSSKIKKALLRVIEPKSIDISCLAKELHEVGLMAYAEFHQVEHSIKCDGIKISAVVSACSTAIKRAG